MGGYARWDSHAGIGVRDEKGEHLKHWEEWEGPSRPAGRTLPIVHLFVRLQVRRRMEGKRAETGRRTHDEQMSVLAGCMDA